jgi:hypothetical protein
LTTEADFSFFRLAATQKLANVKWTEAPIDDEAKPEVDGQDDA